MYAFRSKEMHEKYEAHKKRGVTSCALCEEIPLRSFTFWKIIPNIFPYDKIAVVHHMLVPIKHKTEWDLTTEERQELLSIKEHELHDEYTHVIEALPKLKSIPAHFHLHLVVPKDEI